MRPPSLRCAAWLAVALLGAAGPGRAAPSGAADCPQPLRIAFLDKAIPGMLEGDGDRFAHPPGRFVEWAQAALERLGCAAELVRVPQRRLLLDTAADVSQVTFYFAHTPERARQLVYPLRRDGSPQLNLALSETRLMLFVRADRRREVDWDGQRLLPEGLRVGVVGGGVEEPLAQQAGWRLERAPSHAASAAKLRLNRVDVAVLPALTFSELGSPDEAGLVALEPPLHRIAFFAPVSPALQRTHPQFVARWWRTLCEVARAHPIATGPAPSCQG